MALPATAPFEPADRAALSDLIARASPEQRAWLSGFLAGLAAGTAPAAAAEVPAAGPKQPLTILYATEGGNAEALAGRAAKAARAQGFVPRVLDMAEADWAQVARAHSLLVIASTWGEGDPPARAADAYAALMGAQAPRFDGARFAVLALGDRAYANFCAVGRRIDARLAELGGERVQAVLEADLDFEAPARDWLARLWPALAPPGAAAAAPATVIPFPRQAPELDPDEPAWTQARPFPAQVIEVSPLTSSRSEGLTVHVALSLEGSGIAHQPGDSLGVLPRNRPELVERILALAGLAGEAGLAEELAARRDITTLAPPAIAAHAALAGDEALGELAAEEARARDWARGRQLVDLLEAAPARLSPEALLSLTRPLPPRYYSVASSQRAHPDEAHLCVARVAWQAHGRERLGVASAWLADLKPGDTVPVFPKPSRHFRLPADPAAPILMIGPGTGVAPFRAFLQEREADGATGANWLVFGHRRFTHDFLYQTDWQEWRAQGLLSRVSLAFSRDGPAKRYVQHALIEEAADVRAFVEGGATVYVCGDATAMARDVRAALAEILGGEEALRGLRRAGRFLEDIY
jgi:sulfite reductase (NADPH) flavoprotein alpha-component